MNLPPIGSYGQQSYGHLSEDLRNWSHLMDYGTDTSTGWIPPVLNYTTGNYILKAKHDKFQFYIHTRHVNMVANKRQTIPFYKQRQHIKTLQSNTMKNDSNRFVTDKKKIVSIFGVKNTRIEFTPNTHRSANYTTVNIPKFQTIFQKYFHLIQMTHGEYIEDEHKSVINNVNYTTYLYGVNNPFSVFLLMNKNKSEFLNLCSFSSINLISDETVASNEKNSIQIFASMTLNTQNLNQFTVATLSERVAPLMKLMEVDQKLNWFCNIFGLYTMGFINTPNKLNICWWNEIYYVVNPSLNKERNVEDWISYKNFMIQNISKGGNVIDYYLGQQNGQFHKRNPDVIHLVGGLLLEITEQKISHESKKLVIDILKSHFSHLNFSKKVYALIEMITLLSILFNTQRKVVTRDEGEIELLIVTISPDFPVILRNDNHATTRRLETMAGNDYQNMVDRITGHFSK